MIIFENILLFLSLIHLSSSYYYLRYNSMIYTMKINSNEASRDFTSMFPYELSFSKGVNPEYYIIGRASKTYENNNYLTQFTYLEGDIALLNDYTYVIFTKPALYEKESIYLGSISNFENILSTLSKNTNNGLHENRFFQSDESCSPNIMSINGENEIKIKMDKSDDFGDYGVINFSTKGTEKLKSVPPIYLNNSYLGDYCCLENDKFSIRCEIRNYVWYRDEYPKPVKYRVNELYEGCYGPVYTGITLYVYGEKLKNNLFFSILYICLLLF